MAAATVASGFPISFVAGNKRIVLYKLTTPADTNTVAVSNLTAIDVAVALDTSSSTVAADSVSATWSSTTVTLAVAGTARDVVLIVIGY